MNDLSRYRDPALYLLAGIALGTALGYHVLAPSRSSTFIEEIRTNASGYSYINPLLFVRTTKEETPAFAALAEDISDRIDAARQEGRIASAGVYFRDLDSGKWTGVNESEAYTPSSLLKVAVMMSVFRTAAENPGELATLLPYDPANNVGVAQHVPPSATLAKGYHPVSELVEAMIVRSDNAANATLLSHVNRQFFDLYATFRLPELPDNYQNFMSPRAYSTLFRALYNATYLSEAYSERALSILTRSEFRDGLVAGVPGGTIVAHKFGENATADESGAIVSRELHDCGIIYYPNRPYFLCVMTEGKEFEDLEAFIAEISRATYAHTGDIIRGS